MRNQFDNYEKKIMEKLDREAEDIERRIGEDPQVAEAKADEGLDGKVYARVKAYEDAVAENNNAGLEGMDLAERADIMELTGLSEEDREALRLGRELQRRRREEESRKEAEGKTRKYAGRWKRIVAAAAVLVLVAGVGVNGIGGPNRVVEILGLAIGGREISKINSSTDDAKISEEDIEEEAYQQIEDELGIEPVRITRFTGETNINFKSCEVDSEIRMAQLLYEYGGRNVSYLIDASYTQETWGTDIEDVKIDEYPYVKGNFNAKIVEYQVSENNAKKYSAEFEYKGIYYQLIGTMKWDDFEKILKYLHFPV